MNNIRRKEIATCLDALNAVRDDIQALLEEEQECFDNMPENLAASEN